MRCHLPPSSTTSVPPCPYWLGSVFPKDALKNIHVLGARCRSGRANQGVYFFALPAPVYLQTSIQRESSGAAGGPLPRPGKPAAFWCRRLFLGVEGEGTGKKDRELGRWGQEASERVFPPVISLEKGTAPSRTSPPLACEPRAPTVNRPTHPRCAVPSPRRGLS